MKEPPLQPVLICQRCGAANPTYAAKCWLCSTTESTGDFSGPNFAPRLVPLGEYPQDPGQTRSLSRTQQVCAGLLVACVLLTILIVIGCSIQDPGMLVPLLIVVGPAYLATGLRALHDYSSNRQLSPSSLLLTFLFSGLFGVMALVLFAIVTFVAFFVWCLAQLK